MEIINISPIIDLSKKDNLNDFEKNGYGTMINIDSDFVPKTFSKMGYKNGSFFYDEHILGHSNKAWAKNNESYKSIYIFSAYKHNNCHQYTTVFHPKSYLNNNKFFYMIIGHSENDMKCFKVRCGKTIKINAGVWHSAPIMFTSCTDVYSYYNSITTGTIENKPTDMIIRNFVTEQRKILYFSIE